MDLPNLFSAQKASAAPERVIGILLSETKVQSVLLSISSDQLLVEASSGIVEYTDQNNCLIQTDETMRELGEESESVEKVVFGLDHDWVADGEIVDEHKPLLQKLSTDLDIKPVGFIDTSEALVHHFLSQNSLYSGIMVLLSTTAMTVSYVSQGKIKGMEQVGRSESIIADLREGLARFSKQVEGEQFYLPAKLVLASFDLTEDELKNLQQELLEFNWTENARFLQMPTIQVIDDEQFTAMAAMEAAKAAAIAAGFYSAATTKPTGIVSPEISEESPETKQTFESEFEEVAPPIPTPELAVETAAATQDAVSAKPTTEDDNLTAVPAAQATSFGIPISSDKLVDTSKTLEELEQEAAELSSEPPEETQGFLANLRSRWNEPYKGNRSLKFFIFTGFLAGLLVISLVMAGYIYATASAVIDVKVKAIPVSKDIMVTLDPSASSSDPDNLVMPASTTEKTVSAESTTATTGVKIVGDQAKGKVTIYNKTTARKTFSEGTVLRHGELEFTLDEEVSVASASVKEKSGGEEKEYGSVQAAVTASDIGADYNLENEASLSVGSFSDDTYTAEVSDGGLTGGASREVRVVSEEDRQNLAAAMRGSLLTKANQELDDEAVEGNHVVPTSKITHEQATFSAEVEEEADNLSLTLEITVEALTYSVDDLRPFAAAVLASQIPDNYQLSSENPEILSQPTDSGEESAAESVTLEAQITSKANPVIDEEEVLQTVSGLGIVQAESALESMEEIESADITLQPSFAALIRKSMPSASKISVNFGSS